MSISPDLWVDWAIKRPGPPNKVYEQKNSRRGIVLHSMEGWLTGSLAELDKPTRQASWTFSLALDGTLYQHYPLDASIWASGNFKANTSYGALELEGLASMPIDPAQLASLIRLLRELGFKDPGSTIREHRQVWNIDTPNAGPTACPSARYAPLYAALAAPTPQEDDQVSIADYEDLILAQFAGAEEHWTPDDAPTQAQVGQLKPRDVRLGLAKYRIAEIAAGRARSVMDVSASAEAAVSSRK